MTSDGELKQLACATYPGVSLVMTLEQRPAPTSASPTYSPTYSPPLSPSYSPPLSPAESLALSPKIATTDEEMVAVSNEGAPLSGTKRTHAVYDEPSTPPLVTAPDGVVDRQSPGDGTDLQERCSHVTPPTTRDSVRPCSVEPPPVRAKIGMRLRGGGMAPEPMRILADAALGNSGAGAFAESAGLVPNALVPEGGVLDGWFQQ